MTVARVIPLRRLPSDVPWFDYLVPDGQTVQRGQFVDVSFRRRPLRGVVWSMADQSVFPHLETIQHIHEHWLTDWQLAAIEALIAEGGSPASIVASTVPPTGRRPRRTIPSRSTKSGRPASHSVPTERTWWYRERAQIVRTILDWASALSTSGIILTPTLEDADTLVEYLNRAGVPARAVHGQTTSPTYRETYALIQTTPLVVVGTWKALLLPFHEPPAILIDQEEHPAHKQSLQYPRYDTRRIVSHLNIQPIATTPAPSISWFYAHHPTPPIDERPRELGALGVPGSSHWLSSRVQDLVTTAHQKNQQLVAIVPRRGFARLIACRDCGWVLACEQCYKLLTLRRDATHHVTCSWCSHHQSIPSQCPSCQGTRWSYHGLGPEHFVDILSTFNPNITAVPAINPAVDATVYVDTYQAVRSVADLPRLAGILVISGDSLLNIPDPVAAERAWQYLNRLQATAPAIPLVVQTFQPDSDFWQRWVSHGDAAWYEHEIQDRRRLQLPPFVETWLVRYAGPNFEQTIVSKLHELTTHHGASCTVKRLPDAVSPQRTVGRLLITSTQPLRDQFDVPNEFPPPWQVDMSPSSWLE
ncbi:MAG: hypothetical protein HY975_01060 [Candidatus Kerfeldbacteria bacterium]|nr:hypothetical protein [Candidatus Kerfeldbacteria bacterium]